MRLAVPFSGRVVLPEGPSVGLPVDWKPRSVFGRRSHMPQARPALSRRRRNRPTASKPAT